MKAEGIFTAVDGEELFFRVIEPKKPPKAAVILVHGHGDHSGGLENISSRLVQERYSVYAFDLRGHGKSSGKRGFIQSWDEFRGDLHEFRKLISKKLPGLPIYIVGHSIGGLITLDYALEYGAGISGIVAIAPAISYEVSPFERLGITIMGKLKPDFSINKSAHFRIMRKHSKLAANYYSDSLRHNIVTPGLGSGLIQAVTRVVHQAPAIKLPLLLQYGLNDKITPPTKLGEFYHEVSSRDKLLLEYTAANHRPFDGEGKETFLRDLIRWLDQQVEKNQKRAVI